MTLGKNENTLGKNENTEKAMKNLVVWKSLKNDQPLAILTKNKERMEWIDNYETKTAEWWHCNTQWKR